jgi:hypothetical protein
VPVEEEEEEEEDEEEEEEEEGGEERTINIFLSVFKGKATGCLNSTK